MKFIANVDISPHVLSIIGKHKSGRYTECHSVMIVHELVSSSKKVIYFGIKCDINSTFALLLIEELNTSNIKFEINKALRESNGFDRFGSEMVSFHTFNISIPFIQECEIEAIILKPKDHGNL